MIRLIFTIIIFALAHSQYVLDRAILLGASISGSGNYLFQTLNFDQSNETNNTYRGSGILYDISIVYSLNTRNLFEFSLGKIIYDITHNSKLFDNNVVDKNIKTKMEFTEFSSVYSYVFPSQNLMFGGGTKIYIPPENFDVFVNGSVHIGLKYKYNHIHAIPYVSYSFPITNIKRSGDDILKFASLQIGLKIWFKIL